MVDDLRDDGDLSGEGARFEEDDCSKELVIVSSRIFENLPLRHTSPNLDEALEV